MSTEKQQTLLIYFLSAIFIALILISCNKAGAPAAISNQTPADSSQVQAVQSLKAQSKVQALSEAQYYGFINDANLYYFIAESITLLQADSALSTGISGNLPGAFICGADIKLDSNATTRTITITYKDSYCPVNAHDTSGYNLHLTAKGVVTLSFPLSQKWGDTSTIRVDIKDLVLTVPENSMTLKGSLNMTNVTGGNPLLLHNGSSPIVQTIKSDNITALFRDGSTSHWQTDIKRTYSYSNGIVITTTGAHANDTASDIAQWGVDRGSNPFIIQIRKPIVNEQSCNLKVTSGEMRETSYINLGDPTQPWITSFTFTFGTDPYTGHNGCPLPGEASYLVVDFWEGNAWGHAPWRY